MARVEGWTRLLRTSRRTLLHAAFRPGQLGPVKAKFLTDAVYNARVKDLARSAERNFRLSPFAMDYHHDWTFPSLLMLVVEATSAIGQPLSKGCALHDWIPVFDDLHQTLRRESPDDARPNVNGNGFLDCSETQIQGRAGTGIPGPRCSSPSDRGRLCRVAGWVSTIPPGVKMRPLPCALIACASTGLKRIAWSRTGMSFAAVCASALANGFTSWSNWTNASARWATTRSVPPLK
jgi:hypothetical protein